MSGVSGGGGRRFKTERWCLLAVTSFLLLAVPAVCQVSTKPCDPRLLSSPATLAINIRGGVRGDHSCERGLGVPFAAKMDTDPAMVMP